MNLHDRATYGKQLRLVRHMEGGSEGDTHNFCLTSQTCRPQKWSGLPWPLGPQYIAGALLLASPRCPCGPKPNARSGGLVCSYVDVNNPRVVGPVMM